MKQNELIINQNNYEGYKELYNTKIKTSEAEYKNNIKVLKKGFATFLIGMIAVIATSLFLPSGLILKNIVISELLATVAVESVLTVDYLIKVFKLKKQKIKNIKNKYPYIDTDIDLNELEKSIANYNKSNSKNDICFEEYIEEDKKIEQIHTKYHNNEHIRTGGICFESISKTEYDNFPAISKTNDNYENQETEKLKVKTLIK